MQTKKIKIGSVVIGGGEKIAIQSMTTFKAENIKDTVLQIRALEQAGATIVRFAVTDEADAKAIAEIKKQTTAALCADIQFDYRLAIQSIAYGIDKVRINPGNIGSDAKIAELAKVLKESGVPVRVGSNSGSLKKEYFEKYGLSAKALSESVLFDVAKLEKFGVENIVLSMKASSVPLMTQSYRYIADKTPYPLHLGVTEAGTEQSGIIKSSIGIGSLLLDGIGDTVRVSLTADPVKEVYAAKKILQSVGLDHNYAEVVSCPTCGRCMWDAIAMANRVEELTKDIKVPIKIAVMGCVVNGIGESDNADVGIAGAKGGAALFAHGKIWKTVKKEEAEREFLALVQQIIREKQGN